MFVPNHRLRRSVVMLLTLCTFAFPLHLHAQDTGANSPSQEDWWTPWYGVDYGLIAAGTTAFVIGEELTPSREALIGPSYNPDDPSGVFSSNVIDQPYLDEGTHETVPKEWVIGALGGAAIFMAGLEGSKWADGSGSARHFHDTMVGFLETTALTAGATSLAKPAVGRLRPDFGDRARRYICSSDPAEQYECDGYRDQPLAEEPEENDHLLLDGRRSFFSGHASHSFSVFSYTSLVIGGHYVWGQDATAQSRAAGIIAQTALMTAAGYISASRVMDGRHHPTDVLTGAMVGLAFANFSYWRRFGLDGQPYAGPGDTESAQFELNPPPAGAGLSITVRH